MQTAMMALLAVTGGIAYGASRPNVVLLLVDDQRNDTLGCAGHPIIKTPAIDTLAANGVRFQNAFVTTSICAASRASILTGLYERTHGYTFNRPPLRAAYLSTSYPALVRQAGYRTGFIGKYGIKSQGRQEPMMFDVFKPLKQGFLEQPDGTKRHETQVAGDQAIDFLESNPDGTPFCLSVSFHAAHAVDNNRSPGMGHFPWPKVVDGMYEDVDIPAPRLSAPSIFENLPEFMKTSLNRQRYFWRWDTPEKYQANMRAYFRMISGIDHVISRIRDELDRLGLSDNTIIIYMGDNGYYMGDRGFAGKWSHYEQSLRVPLIIYDPRLPQKHRGVVNDRMALNIDIPATLLDLAGVATPEPYQGRSLVPLLQGEDVPGWRTDFLCEHLMNHRDIPKWEGVRGERYVYARYFEQDPVYEFLHDLASDPDQLVNLARDPEQRTILERMKKRCDELKDGYEKAEHEDAFGM
jgi:arylsulfatase A-like enzyme